MKMRHDIRERATALALAAVMAFSPISYSSAFAGETEMMTEQEAASTAPAVEMTEASSEAPVQAPAPEQESDAPQAEASAPQDEQTAPAPEGVPEQEATQAQDAPQEAGTDLMPEVNGIESLSASAGSWTVTAYMSDGTVFPEGSMIKVLRIKDIAKQQLTAEGISGDSGKWNEEMDERTSEIRRKVLGAKDDALWNAYSGSNGTDPSLRDSWILQKQASCIFDRALDITVTDADGNVFPKGSVDLIVSVKDDGLHSAFAGDGGYRGEFSVCRRDSGTGEYSAELYNSDELMYGDILMDGTMSVLFEGAESGFYTFSYYGNDFVFDQGAETPEEAQDAEAEEDSEAGNIPEAEETQDGTGVSAQEDVYEMNASADGIVVTVRKQDGGMIPAGSVLTVRKTADDAHTEAALASMWENHAEQNGLDAVDEYYRDAFISQKRDACDLASSYLVMLTAPDGTVMRDGLVLTAEFDNGDLYGKTVNESEKYELVTFASQDGEIPGTGEPELHNTEAFTYGYFAEDGMACIRLDGAGSAVYSVFAGSPSWAFELPPEDGRPVPETEAAETEAETESVTEAVSEEETEAETETVEPASSAKASAGDMTVTVKVADGSDLPEGTVVEITTEDGMTVTEKRNAKSAASRKWAVDLRDSIDYMRFEWDDSAEDTAAKFYKEETSEMKAVRLSVKDADGKEIDDDLIVSFGFDEGSRTGRDCLDGRLDMFRLSEDGSSAESDYEVKHGEKDGLAVVTAKGQANRMFVFAGSVDRLEFGVTEYTPVDLSEPENPDVVEQLAENSADAEEAGYSPAVMNAGLSDIGDRYTDEEIEGLFGRGTSDDGIAEEDYTRNGADAAEDAQDNAEGPAQLELEEGTRTASADEDPVQEMQDPDMTEEDGFTAAVSAKAASATFDDNLNTNSFTLENAGRIHLSTYGWGIGNAGGGTGNYMLKVNGRYYDIYCIEPKVSGAVSDSANKKIVQPLTSTTSSRQILFRKILYWASPAKRGMNGEIKKGAYWNAHTGHSYAARYMLVHFALAYVNGKQLTGNFFNAMNNKGAAICYDIVNWCSAQPDPIYYGSYNFYKVESGIDHIQDSAVMTAKSATPKTPPTPYKRVSTAYSEANLGPAGTVSNDLGTYGTEYYYRISQPVGDQPGSAEVTSMVFADTLPQGIRMVPSTWSVTTTDGRNLTGAFRLTTGMSGIRQTLRVASTGPIGTNYTNVTINLTFRATLSRDDIYDNTDNSSSRYVANLPARRIDYTVYNYATTAISIYGGGLTVNGGGTTNRVTTTANSTGQYPTLSKGVHAGLNYSGGWVISDWTDTVNDPFQYMLRVAIPKNDRVFMMRTLRISDLLPHGIDIRTGTAKELENGYFPIKVYEVDVYGKPHDVTGEWKDVTMAKSGYVSDIQYSDEDGEDNQTISISREMNETHRIDTNVREIRFVVDCVWDRSECTKYKLKKNVVNPDGSINIFYGPDTNNDGEPAMVLNHFNLDTTFSNMPDNKQISNEVRIQTKAIIPSANTKHLEPSVEKYVKAKESDSEWKLITETKDPGENFRYKLVVDTRQTEIPEMTADASEYTLTAGDLSKVRDCFNPDVRINMTSGNVAVPEYAVIGGNLVRITAIADNTFKDCTDIEKLTLPDSVQSIGTSAFEGCTNLEGVNIPSKLTGLGARAFYGCSELRAGGGVMFIPGAVGTVKAGTFCGCMDFTVAICEGITSVEAGAFENTKWMGIHVADGCAMDPEALRGSQETIVAFHTDDEISDYTGGGTDTDFASGIIDTQETYKSMTITDELPEGCRYVSTVDGGPFSVSCENGRDLTATATDIGAESVYEIELECEWVPEDCRKSGNLRFDKDEKIYYYGPLYNNFMLDYVKESRINETTTDVEDSKKSNTVSVKTKEYQPVQTVPQKWIDMDGEIATRDDLDTLKVIHDLYDPSDNTVTFVIRQEIPRTYMWSLRDLKIYDPIINKLDISEISFCYNSTAPDAQYGTWKEEDGELAVNGVHKNIDGENWALKVTTMNEIDVMNLSSLSGDVRSKIGVTAELRIVSSIESARNALDGTYNWEWENDPDLPAGRHAYWTMRGSQAVARIPNRAKTTVTYQCPDDFPYTDYEKETQTVWVEAQLPTANVILDKKNQYDESVLDATFAVYEWNAEESKYDEQAVAYLMYNQQTKKYALPENVYLKRDGYNQGKFKIEEIITPDGYAKAVNTDHSPFSGEIEIAAGETDLQEINVDVYEEYLGMNVEILKLIEGSDEDGGGGIPLAGAVFEIYAKEDITTPEGHVIYRNNGSPLETGITTGADGKAVSALKYYPGRYTMVETEAPRDPVTGKPYGMAGPQDFEIVAADETCVLIWGGADNNFVTQLSGPSGQTLNLDLSAAEDYVDYNFTAENFLGSMVSTVPMKYRLTVDLNQRIDQGLSVVLRDGSGSELSRVWVENGSLRSSGTVKTTIMYGTTTPRIMYESDSFVFASPGTRTNTPYTVRIEGDEAKVFYDYVMGGNDPTNRIGPEYRVKISIDGSVANLEGNEARIYDPEQEILFPVVRKYINDANENDWKVFTRRNGNTEYEREVLYKLHSTFYKNDPDRVTQSAVITDTIPQGLNFTGEWAAFMGGGNVTSELELEADGQSLTISTKTAEFAESLEGDGELYSSNDLDIILHCVWNRDEYNPELIKGNLTSEDPYTYEEEYGPIDNKYNLYTTYLSGEDHDTESNIVRAEIFVRNILFTTLEKWIMDGTEKLTDRTFAEWDAIIPYRIELDTDGDWTGRFTPTLIRIMDVYEEGLTYAKTDDTFAVEIDGDIIATWSYDEIVEPADPDASTVKNGWDVSVDGNTMYVTTSDPDAIQGALNRQVAVLTNMTLSENETKLEKYWTDETHLTVPNKASDFISFEQDNLDGGDLPVMTPPDIEDETQTVTANFEIDSVNLEIFKTDSLTNDPVKDAEFTIYEWNTALEDGAGAYDTRTVDEGGKEPIVMTYDERKGCYVVPGGRKLFVKSTNLGKFKAVETKVPEGYSGTVEKEFTKDEAVDRVVTLNLVNVPASVKLNLQKFDAADGTTPVAGAVYELRPDEIIRTPGGKTVRIPLQEGGTLDYIAGETIDTLTTDAEGKAVSTVDLYPGSYILQEISAPAPYKVSAEPVRFKVTVDEEGKAHTVFTDTLHPEDKDGEDVEYTDLVKAYDEPPIVYPDLVKYVYADNTARNESGDWDLYHWTPDLTSNASRFRYKLQVKIPENIDATKMNSFVLTDALEEGADIVSVDGITMKKFKNNTDGIDADELWFQEDQTLTGFSSIPVRIAFDDDDDSDGGRQAAINAAAGESGNLEIGLERITTTGSGEGAVTEKTRLTREEATGDPLSATFTDWTVYDEYILARYDGVNTYDVDTDTVLAADKYPSVNGGLWGDALAFLNAPEIQAIAPADASMQGDPQYIVYVGVSPEDGSGGTIAGYIDYIEPSAEGTQGVIHLFGNDGSTYDIGEDAGLIRLVQVDGVIFDDSSKTVRIATGTESVSRNGVYSIVPPELDGYTWTVSRKGRTVTVTYTKAGREKDASSMFTKSTSGDVLKLTATGDVSKLEGNILYVYMTLKWDEAEAKNAGHYTGQADGNLTGLRYYHLNNFSIDTAYRSGHTFKKTSNQVKVETWKSFTIPSFTIKKYITEGGRDFKAADDNDPESDPYVYDGHPDGVPYRIDTMIDSLEDPIAAFSSFMITDRFVDALEITGATAIVNGTRMAWTKEEFGTEKEILGMPFILEVAGQDITLTAPNGLPLSAYGKKVSLEVQTHIRDDDGADPFLDPYYYEGFLPSGGSSRHIYRNKAYRVTKDHHTEISFPNISQASAMFGKTLNGDRIANPVNRLSNEVWAKFQYDFKLKIDKKQADWQNPAVPALDGGEPVRVPGAEFEVHPYSDSEGKYLDDVVAALEWNDTEQRYVMADNRWLFKTPDNVNGKFLIEEYVTPEGYKQAPDVEFTISDDNDDGTEDCTVNIDVLEELARMNLELYKLDDDTKGDDVADIPVEGAVYGVFARDDITSHTRDDEVINVIYPAGTLIDLLTTGADGRVESLEGTRGSIRYSELTDTEKTAFGITDQDVASNPDGTVGYENRGYYPGRYYVAELIAPEGYDLDVGRDGTPSQHNFEVTTDTRHPSGTNVTLWYDLTGTNNTERYIDTDNKDKNKYDSEGGDGIGTIMVSDKPSTAKIKIKKTIDKIEDVRWPENGKVTFEFLIRGMAKSGDEIDMLRAITFIQSDYTGMTGPVTLEKEITDLPVGDYRVIELRRNHFKLASLTVEAANDGDTASKTYTPTRGTGSTSIPAQVAFTGGLKVKFFDSEDSASGRPSNVKVKVWHPKSGGGSEVYSEPTVRLNAEGEGTATVSVTGGQLADAWIEPQDVAGYKWYYTHNSTNGFDITYVADSSEFGGISAEDEYAVFDLHTENASGTAHFTNAKRNDEWYLHVKKANANGDPLKNVNFSIFSDNALTRVVATGTTDATGEYVSPMLQEGIYYLEETKSAAGYSLLANAVEMKAESGSDSLVLRINGEIVGSDTTKPIYAQMDADGYYHLYLNVVNQEGFTLPMTGAPLQVGLIVLVIGITTAGVIFIKRKKKRKTA